ncbi:MAG: glycosyltransferase [Phaeodactylibacter sp.]|nr:glycosyltransferase [Phaeodactylibacter sp.]
MIWLASFPRSGNTFFRNVLYEVYGIASSTFHRESNYPLEENYFTYPVVKTHLLPGELSPDSPGIKKVYLVRDGRDALVSLAHHRKDIIEPGTDFRINLLEAILAMEGSFFGGWAENVRQWIEVADVVIRFEDLIEDPIGEVEKLRAVMDLPEPNPDKLPSFQKLKFGKPKYGSGQHFLDDQTQMEELAQKNFRRGKAGGWRDEMPPEYESLFWELHGGVMESLGYERGAGTLPVAKGKQPYRILVEGSKVQDAAMDGVKRYNEELLFSLLAFQKKQPEKWQIDVLSHRDILSLPDFLEILLERRKKQPEVLADTADPSGLMPYERGLLFFKSGVKTLMPTPVYRLASGAYRALPFRKALRWVRQRKHYNELRQHLSKVRNEYQLIHVPLPQNYYYVRQIDRPFVFTIHDLTHRLFPEFHTKDNIELAEKGMQFIIEHKVQAITVSEATRRDLLKEYPAISPKQAHTIYEAANRDSFLAGSREPGVMERIRGKYQMPDKPYLLCLSTLEPRKNLKNTIDAFLQLMEKPANREYYLAVCGRKGWKVGELLDAQHPYAGHIVFTGYVDDEDLPVLYANARAMCYVAHYEGFGLPPLEAMQCGTPVLYGNNSAMPEVVGDGGLAACSSDIGDMAAKMEAILHDEGLRQQLSENALNRARRFSWLKTAFETLHLYEKTIRHENSDHSRPH